MAHLKGIGFENFRVFQNKTYFNFAPLTILTGTNSSGKSSVINGIRILSENFKNIERPREDPNEKTPNIDSILMKDFDVSSIIERYGSLEQFVNYNSKNKEFTFSFVQSPGKIQDQLEYQFVIGIENNRLKSGRVKRIEIKSIKENKSVFSIFEHLGEKGSSPHHRAKIDLVYFYQQFASLYDKSLTYFKSCYAIQNALKEDFDKEEVQKSIDEHNKEYSDFLGLGDFDGRWEIVNVYSRSSSSVISKVEVFKEIMEDFKAGTRLFDFSFMWHSDVSQITEFTSVVHQYYGEQENAFDLLCLDVLKTMSAVEWQGCYVNDPFVGELLGVNGFISFGKEEHSNRRAAFSLREFIFRFIDEGTYYFTEHPFTEAEIEERVEKAIKRSRIERNNFVEKLFIPLIYNLASLPKENFFSAKEEEKYRDFYKVSSTEKYFYNVFLFEVLSLTNTPFITLGSCAFVEAHRIQPKRLFSIINQDLFSKQIKALLKLPEGQYNRCVNFLTKWIREFKIAQKIEIEKDSDSDSFKVYLYRDEENKVLLADYGYGISQILPIILELIPVTNEVYVFDLEESEYKSKLVCIEEPENSLHPALQSKLAEMFAEAVKDFNTQLIIETHSEYLIRKLQYITANKKALHSLDPSDTQIFYFYHPDDIPEEEDQVKEINIKKDGFLSEEFGEGFFDESGRLMIDLLKLQNQN